MNLTKLVDEGPKNPLLRYIVYYPVMFIVGIFLLFIASNVAAEIIGFLLVASCFAQVIIWPTSKLYKWYKGRT